MTIYFIEHGPGGDIKIGYTKRNPYERVARLQTGTPVELRLLTAAPGTLAEEDGLHQRFAALHVRGEWFRRDPALLGFIEGIRWSNPTKQLADELLAEVDSFFDGFWHSISKPWAELLLQKLDRAILACDREDLARLEQLRRTHAVVRVHVERRTR